MRTVTKKHFSVHQGKPRFAQVTVAALSDETERVSSPELRLNGYHITQLTEDDRALIGAAIDVVRGEEMKFRVSLCVTQIESSYVDSHPDAARLAAIAAVAELIDGEKGPNQPPQPTPVNRRG